MVSSRYKIIHADLVLPMPPSGKQSFLPIIQNASFHFPIVTATMTVFWKVTIQRNVPNLALLWLRHFCIKFDLHYQRSCVSISSIPVQNFLSMNGNEKIVFSSFGGKSTGDGIFSPKKLGYSNLGEEIPEKSQKWISSTLKTSFDESSELVGGNLGLPHGFDLFGMRLARDIAAFNFVSTLKKRDVITQPLLSRIRVFVEWIDYRWKRITRGKPKGHAIA